jgi:hypothetical protein
MVFASREVSAFLFKRPSPVAENSLLIPIFLGIFLAMTIDPWELLYKIVTLIGLNNLTGLIEGFNRVRYFTLILRAIRSVSYWRKVQIGLTLVLLDQFIEILLRWLFGGEATPLSSPGSIFFTTIVLGGYILATKRVFDIKYLGKADPHLAALTIGFILSFSLAAGLWPGQNGREVEQEPRREEKDARAE